MPLQTEQERNDFHEELSATLQSTGKVKRAETEAKKKATQDRNKKTALAAGPSRT